MKTIYVIWNHKEDRPAIMITNYGGLVVFLTFEQAQAYLHHARELYDVSEYSINVIDIKQ